tara:strand:+ start:555 stop:743 length:189 start_codon:yes stop_codon:yes gene_type:complete
MEGIMEQIKVRITENYGQRRIVPMDNTGKILAKIAGTKTLTPETIELSKMLGYTFIVVTEEI